MARIAHLLTVCRPQRRHFAAFGACLLGAFLSPSVALEARQSPPPTASRSAGVQQSHPPASPLPRAKKLVLKDGSYQLVREYQVNGDRVHYWDLDSSQWQDIPAVLVDWDATKKAQAEEEQRQAALLASVHKREEESQAEVLDIDASIEVAPSVFLPQGEGVFLFDGRSVMSLKEAESSSNLSKGKFIEKVLVPIPITPTRYNISLKGPSAALQIHSGQPELYIRSTKAEMPEIDLFRAKVHNGNREIEHLDELFGEHALTGKTIAVQPWQIAPGVYRYTPTEEMPPGEYAVVQVVSSEPVSILLWDFGIARGGTIHPHLSP